MTDIRERIRENIDRRKEDILRISHEIHDNPELGMAEHKACTLLERELRSAGFKVTHGAGGLDTSFKAVYKGGSAVPSVVLMAEYDALKEIGHACGHNIIAAATLGAALGLSELGSGLCGSVIVLGTPAEETIGGKLILLDEGEFKDADFGMMVHPTAGKSLVGCSALSCVDVTVEYRGKSAHSAKPHTGINALSAVIGMFCGIDSARSSFPQGSFASGIITSGGASPNVIPDYASAAFCLRARTLADLQEVMEKVKSIAEAQEQMTGARLTMNEGAALSERYSNFVLDELFKRNFEALGGEIEYPKPLQVNGSSDVSNVSLRLPVIQEYVAIADDNVNLHSVEFAEAAASARGDAAVLLAAKTMAQTAYDVMFDPDIFQKVREEYLCTVPEMLRNRMNMPDRKTDGRK